MNDVSEKIRILEKLIKSYKNIQRCKHNYYITAGDNISVTGPTGLYKCCKKCDYKEEVGYIGKEGNVFYEDELKEKKKLSEKIKVLGLNKKELARITIK